MLHDNMNISRLIVHDRQVKEARSRRKTRDAKRARSFEGGPSENKIEIQNKPRFKRSSLIKFHPSYWRIVMTRWLNLELKRIKRVATHLIRRLHVPCVEKGYFAQCLVGTGNWFFYNKSGHKVRDFSNMKVQEKICQASCSSNDPKKNLFYSLCTRGEQETSPNVVTGYESFR